MTIPCITMNGTGRIFYKVPVTILAVITSQYPPQTTHVARRHSNSHYKPRNGGLPFCKVALATFRSF
ncbi:hypothetical protein BDZ97DRAFT_1782516 [Flammula alnicola]|nr:hypothetical protein BDZ97DRAFT_1782516 [Flammula alnicola]